MSPLTMKGSLTALLAVFAVASCSPTSQEVLDEKDNKDMVGQGMTGENNVDMASGSVLHYGRCYTIRGTNGQHLGHQPGTWNNLRFGSGTKLAHFKVCQNLGQCTAPNTYHQTLANRARFWLFDMEGNKHSPKGSFLAADSPPFSSGRHIYPSGGKYRYYINFWGNNHCSDADFYLLGRCPVKLHIDNLREDHGLVITDRYLKTTPSSARYVTVTFHETKCPGTKEVTDSDEISDWEEASSELEL